MLANTVGAGTGEPPDGGPLRTDGGWRRSFPPAPAGRQAHRRLPRGGIAGPPDGRRSRR